MLVPENHNLKAWKWRGLLSAMRGEGLMDQDQLRACLRANIGEYTFEEAFQRTGRSVNISVSPVQAHQKARLLCGYTSPYLLVWSAALASAAVPGIFPPVTLMTKDLEGHAMPYMPRVSFVDGSVVSDLPIERLMHLYDVNFTIVSQTNPHVVPFLSRKGPDEKLSLARLPCICSRRRSNSMAVACSTTCASGSARNCCVRCPASSTPSWPNAIPGMSPSHRPTGRRTSGACCRIQTRIIFAG